MAEITHALSIRQPYVELILRGEKKYEYRTTLTRITGRVFLYAAKKPADDDEAWRKVKKQRGELPTGSILGSVVISGCEWSEKDDCFRYKLESAKRLRKPLVPNSQPQPKFFRPGV